MVIKKYIKFKGKHFAKQKIKFSKRNLRNTHKQKQKNILGLNFWLKKTKFKY